MFDLSWGEVMVIGAVALIVIGPKDLPKALRTVGNMTAKVRRMAGEFQSQFQEAMREAELDEIRKEVEGVNRSVGSFDPIGTVRNEIKGAIEAPVGAGAEPLGAGAAPVGAGTAPQAGTEALPAHDDAGASAPAGGAPEPAGEPAPETAAPVVATQPEPSPAPAERQPDGAKA